MGEGGGEERGREKKGKEKGRTTLLLRVIQVSQANTLGVPRNTTRIETGFIIFTHILGSLRN